MNNAIIQLLVLAAVAIFLILRLRDVLGTRDGFEKEPEQAAADRAPKRRFEVIEGGPDRDITDHVDAKSDAAKALAAMKLVESDFTVVEFLGGARGAYEMILMSFEKGELDNIQPFLSGDVFESFEAVVHDREAKGLHIEANFLGLRELVLQDARFDRDSGTAEIDVRFVAELNSVVRDRKGEIIEGGREEVKRQRDIWTFERQMGRDDPNWQLVATAQ